MAKPDAPDPGLIRNTIRLAYGPVTDAERQEFQNLLRQSVPRWVAGPILGRHPLEIARETNAPRRPSYSTVRRLTATDAARDPRQESFFEPGADSFRNLASQRRRGRRRR